jgi:hypothetical protein
MEKMDPLVKKEKQESKGYRVSKGKQDHVVRMEQLAKMVRMERLAKKVSKVMRVNVVQLVKKVSRE